MALGDDYITLDELKGRLGIDDALDDQDLASAITAASRAVDHFCRRQFNRAEAATARAYRPLHAGLVIVDDFHTAEGLTVTGGGATWDADGVELEPAGGIVDGLEGFPYWRIRAAGLPASVEVTAQWGWSAAPGPVREATLIIAQDLARLKDTAFGVGGYAEYGRIRARENPHAATQLYPYRRNAVRVA